MLIYCPKTQRFSTKDVVVNMRKMLFKPIKHKSWHVTVALVSLYVAFFICVEHPFLGASPDALIEYNCCGQGVMEVKCSFG